MEKIIIGTLALFLSRRTTQPPRRTRLPAIVHANAEVGLALTPRPLYNFTPRGWLCSARGILIWSSGASAADLALELPFAVTDRLGDYRLTATGPLPGGSGISTRGMTSGRSAGPGIRRHRPLGVERSPGLVCPDQGQADNQGPLRGRGRPLGLPVDEL